MHRRLKLLVSALSLFALTAFLIGCGAPAANNTATNANSATTAKPTPAATTPANTMSNDNANAADNKDGDETASADKIGVPECDDYMAKVNACISSHVPADKQEEVKKGMEASMKAWKMAAGTAQGKATLPGLCKQAAESAKTSFSAYKCEW